MKTLFLLPAALLLPLRSQAQPAAPPFSPASRPLGDLPGEASRLRPDASAASRFAASVAASPDDQYWDDRFTSNGVNPWVNAMLLDGSGNLYVGGSFSGGVAKWDGIAWSIPGGGYPGQITDLEVDAAGNLYVSGHYGVAMWDGIAWRGLGGFFGTVYTLAWRDGILYAGGQFTEVNAVPASNVARWDGTDWSPLGAGVDDGVHAFAFDQNGHLFVGGAFTAAGGAPASRIARWDGTAWFPLGAGIETEDGPASVVTLVTDGDLIYAGGVFLEAGGVPSRNVAVWDGAAWSALDGLDGYPQNWPVRALAVHDGTLYATGSISINARQIAVAKWTGETWVDAGTQANGGVNVLAFEDDGTLFIGGSFTLVEGVQANFVARHDGAWSALGPDGLGVPDQVYAMTMDGAGRVYVAAVREDDPMGTFFYEVRRWDGTGWTTLGDAFGGQIMTLAVDAAGNVYAGGHFTNVGSLAVNKIAKWDGTAWSALGTGIHPFGYVLSIDCYGNSVYVGGIFTLAGGVPASNVARWNGKRWLALGDGTDGEVRALAVRKDGVYAGGSFDTAGGVTVNKVARWDGSTWSALGTGIVGYVVEDLHFHDGKLFAGGTLWQAGDAPTYGLARWNGAAWSSIGMINGVVNDLTSSNGKLYAAGAFNYVDAVPANNVARWDGRAWSSLGSGISGVAVAVAADAQNRVYVGGQFMSAGGKLSYNFALFAHEAPSLTLTAPGATAYTAGSTLRITWTSTELPPLSRVYVDLVGPVGGGEAPTVTRLKVTANDLLWTWPIPAGQAPGSYRIRLTSALNPALTDESEAFTVTAPVEAAARAGAPEEVVLEEAYPNPFNPTTTLTYALPEASAVRLEVFDLLGRRVALLADGVQEAGTHAVRFDGAALASGTYLYRLQAGAVVLTRRMVLMK